MIMKLSVKITFITLLLFLVSGCARNPVTGKKDLMLISKEQEVEMGREADPQVIAYFGLYKDEALQRFIQEKGEQMAAISHRPELEYQFRVVDSPVVNAFALPGGFVYFTRGIMAHFNSEAEFTGVLGHEIGHITARHSAQQYSNALLANVGLTAGSILSPEFAQFAGLAEAGVGLLFLKFSRDDETEADKLGVQYSTTIGYDASQLANFFGTLSKMEEEAGGSVPTFLSTHPNPANREKNVLKLAQQWKNKTDAASLKISRDNYLKMIDGIIYGEDPRQGYVEEGTFYHPDLRFQFDVPGEWDLQNTPQQVRMAPKDGTAIILLALAEGGSPEEASENVLKEYQLEPLRSERKTVNGLEALAIVADQYEAGEEGTIRTLIYLIQYRDNIYSMIGASSIGNFELYRRTFESTMNSFRELKDKSKIERQPEKVRVRTVAQESSLDEALETLNVPQDRREEVAFLNGMTLDETVEEGMLLKIIGQ